MRRWKSGAAPHAEKRNICTLKISAYPRWPKWNLKRRLNVHRRAVFCSGLKLPLRERQAGELIEALIDSAQHPHISHTSIGVDNRIEDHRPGHILPHKLQRV